MNQVVLVLEANKELVNTELNEPPYTEFTKTIIVFYSYVQLNSNSSVQLKRNISLYVKMIRLLFKHKLSLCVCNIEV